MHWEKIETAHISTDPGLFGATSNISIMLSRAQVPGGWLVLAATTIGADYPVSITFYPDPTHSWQTGTPRDE